MNILKSIRKLLTNKEPQDTTPALLRDVPPQKAVPPEDVDLIIDLMKHITPKNITELNRSENES